MKFLRNFNVLKYKLSNIKKNDSIKKFKDRIKSFSYNFIEYFETRPNLKEYSIIAIFILTYFAYGYQVNYVVYYRKELELNSDLKDPEIANKNMRLNEFEYNEKDKRRLKYSYQMNYY